MHQIHQHIRILLVAAILTVVAAVPVLASTSAAVKESRPAAKAVMKVMKPIRRPAGIGSGEALPATDIDETLPLPKYPEGARTATGKMQTYAMGEEDTLIDVARYYHLGYIEARAANLRMDPWTPVPGEEAVIPTFKLLPRAPQKGIVVNLAQMRLYYFKDPKKEPLTFPIGIGREGLQTPTGETRIVRKAAGPTWFPTERMREEKPYLPAAVTAGPSNPLGTHALYLGWPTFLIHGSNKPWAIGRRVSSGCMRMYPEDIVELYKMAPVGTKVTVVDQPILVGWVGDDLYLEANPSKTQGNDIEIEGEYTVKELDDALRQMIINAAAVKAEMIDWEIVKKAVEERAGYPVPIANAKNPPPPEKKSVRVERRFNYN
jgi:L,D-transpeptidase ErfK/SrfK